MKLKTKRVHKKKYVRYKKNQEIREKIEKRYKILIGIVITVIGFLSVNLFYVQIIKHQMYVDKVMRLTQNTFSGPSTPRGRIYDRNGNVIVDNTAVKVISYKRKSGTTTSSELNTAEFISQLIEVDSSRLSDNDLRKYWLKNNYDLGKEKIKDEEWQQLKERKLSSNDIESIKLERITEEELNSVNRNAAYIYTLMNNGYSYDEKVIKKINVTEEEYASVASNIDKLPGFKTTLSWERYYPYGSVFRSILGSVSTSENGIPYELKNYYLSKGYSLNDRVGISYLEYQYEDLLKGKKDLYQVSNNDDNILLEAGKRGKDIVLTIDIELQKEVESILEKEIRKAKNDPNTEYYNKSFVIVSNPNTGEILAMSGKQIVLENGKYQIYDYTPGIFTSSVVAGSIVKGASHIVGYDTGALKIGEVRDDTCIKIASTPLKCSWKYLGRVDDIKALKYSSNTYQFNTAIKVGKGKYSYDKPIIIEEQAFQTYRNKFAEFGLGVKTGIDLPNESLGYKGTSTLAGHLFDFAIGQYDTYTPIQLNQYINTIANGGSRVAPYLLKAVYEPTSTPLTNLISETKTNILNTVNVDQIYMNRVRQGFKEVMEYGGTGSGYIAHQYNPAGKTGTSESFIDTNNDGVVDKETITNTFGGYAPYDKPIVSFTVVSPDIYNYDNNNSARSSVNVHITKEVSKKFFEIYQ